MYNLGIKDLTLTKFINIISMNTDKSQKWPPCVYTFHVLCLIIIVVTTMPTLQFAAGLLIPYNRNSGTEKKGKMGKSQTEQQPALELYRREVLRRQW